FSLLNNKYDTSNINYQLSESNDSIGGTYEEVDALMPFLRFFISGSFYYTTGTLDLSRSTQQRYTLQFTEPNWEYIWNHHMAQPLFHLRDSLNKINPFQSKFL
ncbi:hypothetical protein HMI55_005929, partial [Coelomomyces lativittatus]